MTSEQTCRGSIALGTACGSCSRCKEETGKLHQKSITHHSHNGIVEIKKYASVEDAPNYVKEGGYKACALVGVAVVANGTIHGDSTVDLVFVDGNGNKHVAIVHANVIRHIKGML